MVTASTCPTPIVASMTPAKRFIAAITRRVVGRPDPRCRAINTATDTTRRGHGHRQPFVLTDDHCRKLIDHYRLGIQTSRCSDSPWGYRHAVTDREPCTSQDTPWINPPYSS